MKTVTRACQVLGLLALLGCVTSAQLDKVMESWVGHDKNELIVREGAPQKVMEGDDGGKIFVYSTVTEFYEVEHIYWIDKNGRIYKTSWN